MIVAWLGAATLVWIALHASFDRWGRGWTLDRPQADEPSSRVRACVPARDEGPRIGACVAALRRSPAVAEIVVADDESADDTADRARAAGATVLQPGAPPPGWAGKPWACAAAARDADRDWLLFVDADVIVDPSAVTAAVERAERDGADLLSLFGSWQLESPWERVAIPAIGWFIRGAVDLDAVNGRRGGMGLLRAFANGQFMLVRRDLYERIGGHGAVRDAVLDDVRLAERIAAAGGRSRVLWAPWAFRVRLYRGLGEIIAGYRKNLYEGMGRSAPLALLAASIVILTTVLPAVAAPVLWALDRPVAAVWAAAITLGAIAFRYRLERRDGRSGVVAALHPVAGLVLAGVLVASMRPSAAWKGRAFVRGRAKETESPLPESRKGASEGNGAGDGT